MQCWHNSIRIDHCSVHAKFDYDVDSDLLHARQSSMNSGKFWYDNHILV